MSLLFGIFREEEEGGAATPSFSCWDISLSLSLSLSLIILCWRVAALWERIFQQREKCIPSSVVRVQHGAVSFSWKEPSHPKPLTKKHGNGAKMFGSQMNTFMCIEPPLCLHGFYTNDKYAKYKWSIRCWQRHPRCCFQMF